MPEDSDHYIIFQIELWSGESRGHTQGDLTPIFPTFSNPILNLNFYMNADLGST